MTGDSYGAAASPPATRVFYVRQVVGSDQHDGRSPATAWRSLAKLGQALQPGDTAYVGPGLYREMLIVGNAGTAEHRIRLVADPGGTMTRDPPGPVMVTGADAVDGSSFAEEAPGVYRARIEDGAVFGVVEMNGPQRRFVNALDVREEGSGKKSPRQIVAELPSSFHYDEGARELWIHTSDGSSPANREVELIRRAHGIVMHGKPYVSVGGFQLRHTRNSGIAFMNGSHFGVAIGNKAWGGWQGIRVHASEDVLVLRNTTFRNDNSGVYFASESRRGRAVGNVVYENVKGLRWSGGSDDGFAGWNTVFDNVQAGISLEKVHGVRITHNRLKSNAAQVYLRDSEPESEGNCFEQGGTPGALAVLHASHLPVDLRDLNDWRRRFPGDSTSTSGTCGVVPKDDVVALHAATTAGPSPLRSPAP